MSRPAKPNQHRNKSLKGKCKDAIQFSKNFPRDRLKKHHRRLKPLAQKLWVFLPFDRLSGRLRLRRLTVSRLTNHLEQETEVLLDAKYMMVGILYICPTKRDSGYSIEECLEIMDQVVQKRVRDSKIKNRFMKKCYKAYRLRKEIIKLGKSWIVEWLRSLLPFFLLLLGYRDD